MIVARHEVPGVIVGKASRLIFSGTTSQNIKNMDAREPELPKGRCRAVPLWDGECAGDQRGSSVVLEKISRAVLPFSSKGSKPTFRPRWSGRLVL
jgi:hypothetical protein